MELCKICSQKPPAPSRKICYACKSRIWADKNPVAYAWHMLKKSAKKRGYSFTITVDWFKDFCRRTGYMENKGRLFNNYTVDRIDNNQGYEPHNVRVITKSENSRKYHQEDKDNLPF